MAAYQVCRSPSHDDAAHIARPLETRHLAIWAKKLGARAWLINITRDTGKPVGEQGGFSRAKAFQELPAEVGLNVEEPLTKLEASLGGHDPVHPCILLAWTAFNQSTLDHHIKHAGQASRGYPDQVLQTTLLGRPVGKQMVEDKQVSRGKAMWGELVVKLLTGCVVRALERTNGGMHDIAVR